MIGELTAHLWQSTLFAVVAWLLSFALRKNRAKVRYWLWLTASFKFFLPFSLLIGLGSHLRLAPAMQTIAMPRLVSNTMGRIAEPFPEPPRFALSTPGPANWTDRAGLGLWAFGFGTIVLLRLRSWRAIRTAVRFSVPLGIPAAVEIRSSVGVLEPSVVGLTRPILLLPHGIMERLTKAQLDAVLAHELCHVRRRDNLFAFIHMIVECLFWFHPLVWWIGARLIEEREQACDEAVLNQGSEPRAYAEAILNVCKLYAESPLVCMSGVTGANLKRRIEKIMIDHRGQALNRAKKFLLASAGIAALAGPVAVGFVIGISQALPMHAQVPIPVAAEPVRPQAAQRQTTRASLAAVEGVAQQTPAAAAAPLKYQDRRLLTMLFDFDAMTPDDQSRVLQSAVDFVRNRMTPADVAAVMISNHGQVVVENDFTDDRGVLESTLLKLRGIESANSAPDIGHKLFSIETAANMLGVLGGKKALIYFSSNTVQPGTDDQAALRRAVDIAIQTNVAVYPIDARGLVAPFGPGAASIAGQLPYGGMPFAVNGFPGAHAAIQSHPAGELQTLSVPLESFTGRVELSGQVKTRVSSGAAGPAIVTIREVLEASAGAYQTGFALGAGSYVCSLVVREQATGRVYEEVVNFEVK